MIRFLMESSKSKERRIDLRVSQAQKALWERASELKGMSLSAYLLSQGLAAAQADVEKHQKLLLSDTDRDLFLQLLANPPRPKKALIEAMKQFQDFKRNTNNMKWVISPLDGTFGKSHFDCGYPQLNDFLKKYASQNVKKGYSLTFVATKPNSKVVFVSV